MYPYSCDRLLISVIYYIPFWMYYDEVSEIDKYLEKIIFIDIK